MSDWPARVLTIFPDMFPGPLGQSLAGRALDEHRWSLDTVDIRQFAIDKHHTVKQFAHERPLVLSTKKSNKCAANRRVGQNVIPIVPLRGNRPEFEASE